MCGNPKLPTLKKKRKKKRTYNDVPRQIDAIRHGADFFEGVQHGPVRAAHGPAVLILWITKFIETSCTCSLWWQRTSADQPLRQKPRWHWGCGYNRNTWQFLHGCAEIETDSHAKNKQTSCCYSNSEQGAWRLLSRQPPTLPIIVVRSPPLSSGFWASPTLDGSLRAFSLENVLHSEPTSMTRSPTRDDYKDHEARLHCRLAARLVKQEISQIRREIKHPGEGVTF